MKLTLKKVYTNRQGHRVQPYQYDNRGGRVNERVYVHNFYTGYDEAWSTRLFLAEHNVAPLIDASADSLD